MQRDTWYRRIESTWEKPSPTMRIGPEVQAEPACV
jgi:hypothetical protein